MPAIILFIAVSFSARNGPSALAATAAGETHANPPMPRPTASSRPRGSIGKRTFISTAIACKEALNGKTTCSDDYSERPRIFESQALECQPSMQRGCVARPKADFRRSCAGPIRAAHCLQRERLATEIETGLNPKGIQLRCRGGASRGDPIRLDAVLLGKESLHVFSPM